MTEQDEFVALAPPLSRGEMDAINALFTPYIFRRSTTGEIWTTCCRRHAEVTAEDRMVYSPERDFNLIMTHSHQREPRRAFEEDPLPSVQCPYCGRTAVVKELRYTGKRNNLNSFRRALVLRWHEGALWGRAYNCEKTYTDARSLTGEPDARLIGVYRFRPGLAEGTSRYYLNYSFRNMVRQDGPLKGGAWKLHSPWGYGPAYGTGFDMIGAAELQESPFRYCCAERYFVQRERLLELLSACCFYPRQIEMLTKAEMGDVVMDLANGIKHASVLDWSQEDPRKAFRVPAQVQREFLAGERDIRALEIYKGLRGAVTMREAAEWLNNGIDIRKTASMAKKWNIPTVKLARYLNGQVGCAGHGGLSSIGTALQYWKDYLDAAEALGDYPLHHENTLMPRNLGQAHDEATGRHRQLLQSQRDKERAERVKKYEEKYKIRRQELERKYAFDMDGYLIRVPSGSEEILEEGRALKHCVGGYAERHKEGRTTILFMRKAGSPDKPWLTIEMMGNKLVQIHGYRNEGVFSSEGRFAPDPREVYGDFLDVWLEWLKKGSKRDKEGRPKLPGKKERISA